MSETACCRPSTLKTDSIMWTKKVSRKLGAIQTTILITSVSTPSPAISKTNIDTKIDSMLLIVYSSPHVLTQPEQELASNLQTTSRLAPYITTAEHMHNVFVNSRFKLPHIACLSSNNLKRRHLENTMLRESRECLMISTARGIWGLGAYGNTNQSAQNHQSARLINPAICEISGLLTVSHLGDTSA